jgi:hypothetical protein
MEASLSLYRWNGDEWKFHVFIICAHELKAFPLSICRGMANKYSCSWIENGEIVDFTDLFWGERAQTPSIQIKSFTIETL